MTLQPDTSTDLLGQAVRLLGILVVRGMPDSLGQTDRILVLNSAGLAQDVIAKLLGVSSKTVANRISEAKTKSANR
jgi:hypothetical protein